MRFLVVDDSETMRRILTKILQELGISEIDQAADGTQGVALATQQAYDCVLLDWNMPKMLGIDALKAIRASGNQVPIVMVTTDSERARMLEAIQAGATNYVMKPFQRDALLGKIRQVVGLPT